mgnify:CR=1 FL=1
MSTANSNPFKVFVVEDDEWYSEFLKYSIELIPEFEAEVFRSGKDVLAHLHEQPAVITLDFNLPDTDGMSLLRKIKSFNKDIQVLMISKQEKIETALELLREGAYDYLTKSDDLRDKLINTLQHLFRERSLQNRISHLEQEVTNKFDAHKNIIGNSDVMKRIFMMIDKAAQSNIIVSITGETGTGKEEVAKAIHYNSSFSKGPFVAVNMAAIPKELAESELFGHEKGSFTSAIKQRIGKFEQANNGTLFLDEIGDMSLTAQAKVLRALQEGKITRVGADKEIAVDVRVIAATNKDLMKETEAKNFRLDLYHRLSVILIHVPSLNNRKDDIPLLVDKFLVDIAEDYGQAKKAIDKKAIEALQNHNWTGNIRELRNVVERLVILSGKTITAEDIHSYVLPG